MEPGLSLTRVSSTDPISLSPVVSVAGGTSIFVNRFFHFYAEARGLTGRHLGYGSEPVSLTEVRFSMGLGGNLGGYGGG